MFAVWGRAVYRWRVPVLIISAVLFSGSLFVAAQGGQLKGGALIETSESGRGLDLLQSDLPRASGSSFSVVFTSQDLEVADPAFADAVADALAEARADPRVVGVITGFEAASPEQAEPYFSRDGNDALAVISLTGDFSEAQEYYVEIREMIRSDRLTVTATGNLAVNHDFNVILEEDLQRAELVSLPLALVLLLIVFGSVVAALVPLGVGILAVLGGVAGTFALSRVTDVSQYALNIVTLIGLGVAIDYSLFIVNRFREELRRTASVETAIERSMATAGRAIAFSGLTVAIGLSGMFFYQGTFLSSMGIAGAIVVAFAVLYGLTFLPALLAMLGPRVDLLRVPLPRGRGGFWRSVSTGVMRRPVLVLIPVLAFVLWTASPFLQIQLAIGDENLLPERAESRRGSDLLRAEFPDRDLVPITIVAHFPGGEPLAPERVAALYDVSRRAAAMEGVRRVEGPLDLDPSLDLARYQALYAAPRETLPAPIRSALAQSVGEHIVVLSALSPLDRTTDEAHDLVRRVRALPDPPGGELLVTGLSAFDIDIAELIAERSVPAIAWIVGATCLVLFLLLGSVVLPLKAVVMNLLSIATSFGAMVWIFQQGHLSEQLGFTAAPIDPTLPVIMFCIVFGLSMDYEVLLLSRIQEEYGRVRDNARAVAEGLERSGRLITGAAAIMVGVFGAFALAEVVIIKAVGLGQAIAIAIDATLVRALVVPSTMRLLGDVNWWAPRPLARLYRRLGLAETSVEPAPPETGRPAATAQAAEAETGLARGEAP